MISGNATIRNAVTATKEGAYDFTEKPISKEKLLISIKHALQNRTQQKENVELRKQVAGNYEIIGESAAVKDVLNQIAKVAPTNGLVLITGESGTVKGVDRSRHSRKYLSKRWPVYQSELCCHSGRAD